MCLIGLDENVVCLHFRRSPNHGNMLHLPTLSYHCPAHWEFRYCLWAHRIILLFYVTEKDLTIKEKFQKKKIDSKEKLKRKKWKCDWGGKIVISQDLRGSFWRTNRLWKKAYNLAHKSSNTANFTQRDDPIQPSLSLSLSSFLVCLLLRLILNFFLVSVFSIITHCSPIDRRSEIFHLYPLSFWGICQISLLSPASCCRRQEFPR